MAWKGAGALQPLFALALLAALAGCAQPAPPASPPASPPPPGVQVTALRVATEDGFVLRGDLYTPASPNGLAVVLVPMLGRDRGTWRAFAARLAAEGYTVASYDPRGHGESVEKNGERVTWQAFSEQDFQRFPRDLAAVVRRAFPDDNGAVVRGVFLVGASIGANIVLSAALLVKKVKGVVALSPGLVYRGLSSQEAAAAFQGPVFFVASEEDAYAAESARALFEASPSPRKRLHLYQGAGHGTDMLNGTDLQARILAFLGENA